jgi:hypothetical protein
MKNMVRPSNVLVWTSGDLKKKKKKKSPNEVTLWICFHHLMC